MRTRRGVSAIEFSLVITVLLVILLGLVDWSWYMVQFLDVGVAVSRGARIAAGNSEDPAAAASEAVCASLEAYRLTCVPAEVQTATVAEASGPAMTVSYTMDFHAPVGLVPSPNRIHATASTAWYGYLYQ